MERSATSQPATRAGQDAGASRRRPDGRERPYRALRALAKLYTVMAPLVLGSMILIGIVTLANDAPLAMKVGSGIGVCMVGAVYYLIMKSMAQAIYLMFDMSANVSRICDVSEFIKNQTIRLNTAASQPASE